MLRVQGYTLISTTEVPSYPGKPPHTPEGRVIVTSQGGCLSTTERSWQSWLKLQVGAALSKRTRAKSVMKRYRLKSG
jgi:hypothetical protein